MKIKTKQIRVRDPLMIKIINGATKAAVHKDHKKEVNRLKARRKVTHEKCDD